MKKSAFRFYKGLGFVIALIVSGVGAILGWYEGSPAQHLILYTLATFALILWGWHHFSVKWRFPEQQTAYDSGAVPSDAAVQTVDADGEALHRPSYIATLWASLKYGVIALLVLLGIFIGVSFAVDGFFTFRNVLAVLVLLALLILTVVINSKVRSNKSGFIGMTVLVGLFLIGTLVVPGFLSALNIKSMLVFASFLGMACIGQTLVALLGGLDLSIPFVIGSSNIGLMYLLNLGIPPWLAFIAILLIGAAIGFVNGVLSFRLQGQALILSLGVGFAVSGGTQILTSIGSEFGGNVFGVVPGWLTNVASVNGQLFGIKVPPVVLVWIVASVVMIVGLRNTSWGRNLYALGGSRTAAARLSISERAYWIGVYSISGLVSSFTGALLLGWSGGGFIGVGDQYLFMTLAAVVVGGTSLLGGWGGYGFTVIGVLVLQELTSFLVGIGLSFEAQQFVFGLIILPMVALYARSPHIRTQI